MDLTYWLRKTPQPTTVLADDKKIEVPKNARAWKDLTATIKSLEPQRLTCLDRDGNVIRSVTLESDEEKPAASPEMSDLQLFAKLLAEAYEKGAKGTQPIIESSMQFIERLSARQVKAEGEIERLRAVIHKQNLQIIELNGTRPPSGEESVFDAIVAGALQGAAAANQTPPPTPIKQGAKK